MVFAEEPAKVTDAVNVFAYNPDNPAEIHPLYAGDTLPFDSVVYLADSKSRVTFTQQGETVVLDQPGFYDTSGQPVEVTAEVHAQVEKLVNAKTAVAAAESLIEDAKAGDSLGLYVNEPQNVSSPSE